MPPSESGEAPIAVPRVQEPPAGLTRARWLYVDEARSHEVHAGVRPGAPPEFVVREAEFGNVEAAEVFQTVALIREPWEAQFHHMELETRLSLLGRYWRHDALKPGWTRVRPPPATESLDMREVDVPLFPGDATFYHFHAPAVAAPEAVLVRLPQFTPAGLRFLLVEARIRWEAPDRADVTLLHARLPVTPMRSVLARQHREWSQKQFRKLAQPDDFERTHGRDWKLQLLTCYRDLLDRIAHGQWGAPRPENVREQPLDDPYTDYVKWLGDPRVAALHAKYLTPEEEASLLSSGEAFIRQAIARKRAAAPVRERHLLAILEASLLARDGLRHGAHKVDPEVAALVRRFAYYL